MTAVCQKLCLIRLPEVRRRIGLSRSSIYAKVALGDFPAPVSLGGRAVGWLESDIDTWIEKRIEARRTLSPVSLSSPVQPLNARCGGQRLRPLPLVTESDCP